MEDSFSAWGLRGEGAEAGSPPTIWLVSVNQWERALLRAELLERGLEVIGFVHPEHALYALSLPVYRRPDLMVVDLTGIIKPDVTLPLLAATRLSVVLLGGQLQLRHPVVKQHRWRHIVARPVRLGDLADLLERLVR
ncbi:MAG: hypothetical protein D6773_16535 [Alphaproteobacteria bacterium]|nr:MAG: hypothetical protein D6773_16535 [Alphaproteobacteria bacterium]